MECKYCKLSSPVEEFFMVDDGGVICPTCDYKKKDSYGSFGLVCVPLLILIGTILLKTTELIVFSYTLICIGLWMVFSYFSIVVHEFGHYFFCRVLGGECPLVTIGEGKALYKYHAKKTTWTFSANPSLGLAYAIFPSGKDQAWKEIIVLLAGMFCNLLIVLICLALMFDQEWEFVYKGWRGFLLLLIVINTWMIFSSLFSSLASRGLMSDGHAIYELIRHGKKINSRSQRWIYELIIADALSLRRDYGRVEKFILSCEKYEESVWHLMKLSFTYAFTYRSKEFLQSTERVVNLLEVKGVDALPEGFHEQYTYALAQNNLAFALYATSSPDKERLLTCAKNAFKLMPWNHSIRGTYGAVLSRSEFNIMEGVEHLEAIIRKPLDVSNDTLAINYYCLAEGYERLGENQRAKEAYKRAIHLNCQVANYFSKAN